jgi:hypothetical protein
VPDAVTTNVLHSGSKRYVAVFTNKSDGTGEAAVQKVDISALVGAPTAVEIERIVYDVTNVEDTAATGPSLTILFDHDTDDVVLQLGRAGEFDFREYGGLRDPASDGGTGDILFTFDNPAAGDGYTVLLELALS